MSKFSNYKSIGNNLGISLQSQQSEIFIKESIEEGNCKAFFELIDQIHTQYDLTSCGTTNLLIILNSLEIDPQKNWKT